MNNGLAQAFDEFADEKRKQIAWLLGRDTGASSVTIFCVMTGHDGDRYNGFTPCDYPDFGRCRRLLELFPGWRSRLHEVAIVHPRWNGLVENWDELTEMHKEDMPEMLYARIRELT